MTTDVIIDEFFELIDDDTMGRTRALRLANLAYDRVCTKRMWRFLRKTDTSITLAASTKGYAQPSDYMYPIQGRIYDSTADVYGAPFKPVPHRERRKYHKVAGYFYMDVTNSKITLTADPSSGDVGKTLEFDYQYQPAQLTDDNSSTPVFNRAFHYLIVFEMARMFWYSEQDEKDRSWNSELNGEYLLMLGDMIHHDALQDSLEEPSMQPTDQWLNLED